MSLIERSPKGSTITEIAPALLILLIVTFFPFLNLITIGLSYGATWYLNHYCCQQLALHDSNPTTVQAVKNQVNTGFLNTGLARYLGVNSTRSITHDIVFAPGSNGEPARVKVDTQLSARPLVFIPFFEGSGLDRAVPFRTSTWRVREQLD